MKDKTALSVMDSERFIRIYSPHPIALISRFKSPRRNDERFAIIKRTAFLPFSHAFSRSRSSPSHFLHFPVSFFSLSWWKVQSGQWIEDGKIACRIKRVTRRMEDLKNGRRTWKLFVLFLLLFSLFDLLERTIFNHVDNYPFVSVADSRIEFTFTITSKLIS